MATIEPFAAVKPRPDLASRICELPYDVMSSAEAREIAAGNPLSFLHVSKPEIDLPEGTDLYSPQVYARGRDNFRRLISEGALRQDVKPCFYLYRQIMGNHTQTGLVAVASCQDYLQGIVKKHELTRPDKEDDRVRHIEALNAQTGPAFLVYPARKSLDAWIARQTDSAPAIDFRSPDGVRHSAWTVAVTEEIAFVRAEFAQVPAMYIADGHHRSAAAARVFQARRGEGRSGLFLSVIFPDSEVKILPYNRVLLDFNGQSASQALERLNSVFEVQPGGAAAPGRHEVGFYLEGLWHRCIFRPHLVGNPDPMEQLDVTLLQKHVLAPIFGIDDPRTSKRIAFVGGIRGTAELEKLVNTRQAVCAFSMHPTGIGELMAIADAGGIMPPKSTWFEPKLRDAMFCHTIRD